VTDREGRSDEVRAELLGGGVEPIMDILEETRVRRIASEAAQAFRAMASVRRGVAVFGSAIEPPIDRWGSLAREIARALAEAGFTVITGGGPGLMAAANAAALQAGGTSVGLTIHLPNDEPPNEFLTLEVPFHYFFLRKLAFVKYGCAFVLLPGGYGTLDELFEALNLRRTHRLEPFPVILVGSEFWEGLLVWLRSVGIGMGTLSEEDLGLMSITDDPGEVVRIVADCHATLCRMLGIEA
jgi:uncharacterized protein (TIGR00730 family)